MTEPTTKPVPVPVPIPEVPLGDRPPGVPYPHAGRELPDVPEPEGAMLKEKEYKDLGEFLAAGIEYVGECAANHTSGRVARRNMEAWLKQAGKFRDAAGSSKTAKASEPAVTTQGAGAAQAKAAEPAKK